MGDILHNTVQIEQTDWVSRTKRDAEQARNSRLRMMVKLKQEGILVASVHLPAPGFWKVVRLEGRRYWQAV